MVVVVVVVVVVLVVVVVVVVVIRAAHLMSISMMNCHYQHHCSRQWSTARGS